MRYALLCLVVAGCSGLESPAAVRRLCDGSDPECVDTVSRPWDAPRPPNPPCDIVETRSHVVDGYLITYTLTAHYTVCPTP